MNGAEKILKRTPFGVRVEGVDVVLQVGTGFVRMDYDTANRMAIFLRHGARKAKMRAGDHSLKVFGFAELTDATLEELEAQANRDATAVFARVT